MTAHLASDTVGVNIRMMRKNRGWSVAELAERIEQLGDHISPSVIENIEHGRKRDGVRTRDITVDELIAIADALMVSPGLLLPELISNYAFADEDDRDIYHETIINNLQVALSYLERRRTYRASLIVDPIVPLGENPGVHVQVRDKPRDKD